MNPENQTPPEGNASSAPAPEPAEPSRDAEESIRKVYVKAIRDKERVHTVFRVTRKSRLTARSGKPFLALGLGDKTGEMDGRVFDHVEEADQAFVLNDYLLVEGQATTFQGKPQLVIDRLQRLDPEPIDPAEFALPTPPPAPERHAGTGAKQAQGGEVPTHPGGEEAGRAAVAQIRELTERVGDPNIKALCLSFLDDADIAKGLPIAPAAKGIHHAYRGGLAEHILSVMRLAHRMADHYPMADRDLLVAGALLHDIDKVREISPDRGFEYTDQGRLVGHIVMTAQKIHEKAARIPGFPPLLEHHVTHLVLAHHGQLEYGSPKLPMTLEAHIVHAIDSLDSRIASWLELMAKDPNETWTEASRLYERHLWKGPLPTVRGKSAVDGRTGHRGRRDRKRGGKGGGPQVSVKGGAPRGAHSAGASEPSLSFRPLSELTETKPEPSKEEPN